MIYDAWQFDVCQRVTLRVGTGPLLSTTANRQLDVFGTDMSNFHWLNKLARTGSHRSYLFAQRVSRENPPSILVSAVARSQVHSLANKAVLHLFTPAIRTFHGGRTIRRFHRI